MFCASQIWCLWKLPASCWLLRSRCLPFLTLRQVCRWRQSKQPADGCRSALSGWSPAGCCRHGRVGACHSGRWGGHYNLETVGAHELHWPALWLPTLAATLPLLCRLNCVKCLFPKELGFYYSRCEVEAAASIRLKSDSSDVREKGDLQIPELQSCSSDSDFFKNESTLVPRS